jgi:hypothetical protein
MAKCPIRLFAIVVLLWMLGAGQIARAADEPVATAPIPPPLAAPPASAAAAPKSIGGIAGPAKPHSLAAAEVPKRTLRPPALPRIEPAKHAAAQKPSRPAKRERHLLVARAYPPPGALPPRYYYPGAPVFTPDNEGPPFPPPWYDRGGPLAGYPGPGPRGPW